MTRMKQIATAAGTLACAVGIGFFMQNSDTAQKRYGSVSEVRQDLEAAGTVKTSNAFLNVADITLTSGELETITASGEAEVIMASAGPAMEAPALQDAELEAMPTENCEMAAQARPVAAAMVKLTMQAACLPNERVTIHHNGMIFTETTSDTGAINLTVPALAENAVYIMAFANGEGAVAQTNVEELKSFDRVVLQWKGSTGFQIHAREFGAEYGDQGHVWEGAPGEIANAITGEGGYITRLGDTAAPDALMAEVYTFPATATARVGQVALSVETEVTDINCGLEVEAQTLEVEEGGRMKTRNLTLAVPECDAKGSFLVLNNLIQDLKVAAK